VDEKVFTEALMSPEFIYSHDNLKNALIAIGYEESRVNGVINNFTQLASLMAVSSETSSIYFGDEFSARLDSSESNKIKITALSCFKTVFITPCILIYFKYNIIKL